MSDFMGVILAAGKGTRLYPITHEFPKSLIPIANKSIMEHQIEILKNAGIKEVLIVVGHYGFEITRILGDGKRYGVAITYVEQKEPLGSANAIGIASKYINRPFLLILGDIYFKINYNKLKDMLSGFRESGANAILATKQVDDLNEIKENFSLKFDETGRVIKVIEKPKKIENNIKGCGIYLFDENIFEAVHRTSRTALRDEYELTDSIQKFIDLGYNVYYSNIIEEDINLNYPFDLYQINMKIASANKGNILGDGVRLGKNVSISNSVIGNDVVIEDNVSLINAVVFNNMLIKAAQTMERCIITKNGTLRI